MRLCWTDDNDNTMTPQRTPVTPVSILNRKNNNLADALGEAPTEAATLHEVIGDRWCDCRVTGGTPRGQSEGCAGITLMAYIPERQRY